MLEMNQIKEWVSTQNSNHTSDLPCIIDKLLRVQNRKLPIVKYEANNTMTPKISLHVNIFKTCLQNRPMSRKWGFFILTSLKSWVRFSTNGLVLTSDCERPQKCLLKKRDIWVLLGASLFFGKWCGVTNYFLYKKIRKNTKYKIHDWIVQFSLIE